MYTMSVNCLLLILKMPTPNCLIWTNLPVYILQFSCSNRPRTILQSDPFLCCDTLVCVSETLLPSLPQNSVFRDRQTAHLATNGPKEKMRVKNQWKVRDRHYSVGKGYPWGISISTSWNDRRICCENFS